MLPWEVQKCPADYTDHLQYGKCLLGFLSSYCPVIKCCTTPHNCILSPAAVVACIAFISGSHRTNRTWAVEQMKSIHHCVGSIQKSTSERTGSRDFLGWTLDLCTVKRSGSAEALWIDAWTLAAYQCSAWVFVLSRLL